MFKSNLDKGTVKVRPLGLIFPLMGCSINCGIVSTVYGVIFSRILPEAVYIYKTAHKSFNGLYL